MIIYKISEVGRGWEVPVFELLPPLSSPQENAHAVQRAGPPQDTPGGTFDTHKPWSTLMCAQEPLPVKKVALRGEARCYSRNRKVGLVAGPYRASSGDQPLWITTMSETGKKVSHDFHDIYQSLSRDEGKTWSKPEIIHS